jgi:16S rRNA G966 N2-methylase RsmD
VKLRPTTERTATLFGMLLNRKVSGLRFVDRTGEGSFGSTAYPQTAASSWCIS